MTKKNAPAQKLSARGRFSVCAGEALALTISHVTGWRLSGAYLFTDLTVLALSLSYIPFQRILFSLITVTASSFLIDRVQDLGRRGGAPRGGGQPAQAETA